MSNLSRRSVLRATWPGSRGNVGTSLHRQCRGDDRKRLVGPGLCPGRGRRVQQGGRGLRKGQRQHDRLQHHALRAAAPEDRLGDDQRRRAGPVPRLRRPRSSRCMPGTTSWSMSATSSKRRRRSTPRPRCSPPTATTTSRRSAAITACPYYRGVLPNHIWRPLVEKAGYKIEDIPKTWDAYYDFFKDVQKKLRAQGDAQRLWPRVPGDHQRQRSQQHRSTIS